jgi:hypothetical protein
VARAPRPYVEAAERWGYLADSEAHKYGLPNGATLLLKIASGESGFNMHAVSSAGARGATQFIPETRQSYIDRYGVDPWAGPDQAMHAAAIYMHSSGLASYNPGGGQSYIDYILGQKVASSREQRPGQRDSAPHPGSPAARARAGAGAAPGSSNSPGGFGADLMHIGLVGALVLGGAGMVGLGMTRMLGTGAK